MKYRFVWTFPLTISPHDHKKLYVGSQYVHQTTDDGQSWQIISPDLTTNDKSRQGFSGGLTGDNIGVEYFSTLFAIAESPKEKGLIWTGSNDGLVHITRDGGKNWRNVTTNLPGLPPLGTDLARKVCGVVGLGTAETGASEAAVARVLRRCQAFEPTGIFARSLARRARRPSR